MRIRRALWACSFCLFSLLAGGQQLSVSGPQSGTPPGSIIGTVTDIQDDAVPGAAVVIDGPTPGDHNTVTANETGFFVFNDLRPAIPYRVTIHANGFTDWTSPEIVLKPGQQFEVTGIQLKITVVETTVAALTIDQIALEQVQVEETQRILGVIPNFYVVYDPNPVPLTTRLKYKLAFRTSIDIVNIGGAAFLAGINQAADTPDYVQGARGYAERFGAAYADSFSDIMIGGAILPSLLHQDPRYFYQGTGSNKSRTLHAMSSPFICRGDNGRPQFNYSSIGGDLMSGALSNLYYPESNRGPGLVFENALITTGGRIVSALAQEFLLRNLTTHSRN